MPTPRPSDLPRFWTGALVVGVALGLLLWSFAPKNRPGAVWAIRVQTEDALDLKPGAKVRLAGIDAGRIARITREGSLAELRVEFPVSVTLREGTRALIRPRSAFGGRVLELIPSPDDRADPLGPESLLTAETRALELELHGLFEEGPEGIGLSSFTDAFAGLPLRDLLRLAQTGSAALDLPLPRPDRLRTPLGSRIERLESRWASSPPWPDLSPCAEGAMHLMEAVDRLRSHVGPVAAAWRNALPPPDLLGRLNRVGARLASLGDLLDRNAEGFDRITLNLEVLLDRLMSLDEPAIRTFLQEEGVRGR